MFLNYFNSMILTPHIYLFYTIVLEQYINVTLLTRVCYVLVVFFVWIVYIFSLVIIALYSIFDPLCIQGPSNIIEVDCPLE